MKLWMPEFWWQAVQVDPSRWKSSLDGNDGTLLRTVQAKHSLLLDEARDLVGRRCERQQESMQALVTLTKRLQGENAPEEALSAWLNWGRAGMDRMVDEATDQMQFAGKATQCCLDACAAPFLEASSALAQRSDAERVDVTEEPTSRPLHAAESANSKDAA